MRRLAAVAALLGLASTARAEPARVRPTVEVEAGLAASRLVVDRGATSVADTRSLWVTRVGAGVDVMFPEELLPRGRLRVLGSLGVGLVYATGDVPVHLGGAVLWQAEAARRLSFPVGLGARVVIDTTAAARSYAELALPLGLRYGPVELAYQPTVVIPFGSTRATTFGGERRLGAKLGIAPLSLVLRWVIGW
jgi:hypothetical protein